ncbi:MAG: 2-C-methyl-D-erythritol 2,4-cyclodiphosphate synthase [Alphaproteobacteria bacterium]
MKTPRIGYGYDVHAFEDGNEIVLCGIKIPFNKGFKAHSDGDVAMHAITDAIYGAIADGDIGRHFPPSDDKWKNADSKIFLSHAVQRLTDKGGEIGNIDVTIVCEEPKITPHSADMIENIAGILNIDKSQVSIKATTSEKLGFTGRGEGIATHAMVMVFV